MQHKIKLLNKEENWHRLRNYKPNDTVNHNNTLWQNVTGLNSEPNDTSNDWVDINLGVSEKDLESKLDKPTEFASENSHSYVVVIDDAGGSAKRNATDFGKVDKVMGVAADGNKNVDISGIATNWTNAQQRMSALVSKHNDATYKRLLGMDSQGNLNEVGIYALTNEMSKATDAQKDAWRNASLKTNETYSIGQPRVDSLLPPLLLGTNTSITLIGINLFLNTASTTAKVETIDSRNNSVVETITNIAVHQTIPSKLMFNINRDLYVNEVFYYVRVTHNGLTSFLNTNASFILFKDFENLSVDYQWRIRTLRSQVEPKTYNLELKNTSDFIFKNTGKNSEGNYENAVINIVSDKLLEASKTYIIQAIVKYGISNSANGEKIRFGIIPSNEIPTDESVVTSLLGTGIMGGGYDLNRWIAIPAPGLGRAAQGEYCNLTILIRNGICLVIFKDVVYKLSLPTSMEGTYKLFFNITDGSATYSDIEFVNTNFYQQ